MPPSPTTMSDEIIYEFVVRVTVDLKHPKQPTIGQLENRIGDGVQWLDGVLRVETGFTAVERENCPQQSASEWYFREKS